jgi:hypothetical protein
MIIQKTKQERLEQVLDAALKTISKLPLAYFEDDYIPKPAIDNFLTMCRNEFIECGDGSHEKLNATIDGMLLLQEFTLRLQQNESNN